MASLKERARWAITYVVKNRDLSNKKIAEELGFGEETVGAYRNTAADPKLKFIIAFSDAYGNELFSKNLLNSSTFLYFRFDMYFVAIFIAKTPKILQFQCNIPTT